MRIGADSSTKTKRGFTLGEILVVAAVIGLLSAVVLANVNGARSKGNDIAIKANMSSIQIAAEVFNYQTTITYPINNVLNNSYGVAVATGSCFPLLAGNTNYMFYRDATIVAALLAISKIVGAANMVCSSNIADVPNGLPPSYVVSVPLSNGKYWCIDSHGVAGERDDSITNGDRQCPVPI